MSAVTINRPNMNKQPRNDDIFSKFGILSCDHHPRGTALHEERESIANDEELCEPVDANDGVLFSFHAADYAAERHVDGGCEEGWCDKEEDALRDVGHYFIGFVV